MHARARGGGRGEGGEGWSRERGEERSRERGGESACSRLPFIPLFYFFYICLLSTFWVRMCVHARERVCLSALHKHTFLTLCVCACACVHAYMHLSVYLCM